MPIRKEHDRAEKHCAERATLSHAVSNTITEEYLRKKTYQDASTEGDPIVLWAALQTARDALPKVDAAGERIRGLPADDGSALHVSALVRDWSYLQNPSGGRRLRDFAVVIRHDTDSKSCRASGSTRDRRTSTRG